MNLNRLLFLYIGSCVIITKLFHEPWRDEYQIVGFLNHFPTFRDIFKESTAELLTPIFYYAVKILTINGSYVLYSWIIVIVSLYFLYKVVMKVSVPIYLKCLLALPHIWFHWIVITRVYSVLLIFILMYISISEKSISSHRKKVILLSCMNFLGIFGIFMSTSLYLSQKLQLGNKLGGVKTHLIYILSLAVGIYPYIARPLRNVYYLKSNKIDSLSEYFVNLKIFITNQFNLFIGIPLDDFHFLTRVTQYLPVVHFLFGFLVFMGLVLILVRIYSIKWKFFLLILTYNIILINWFVLVFQGADRHWIFYTVFNIILLSDIKKDSDFKFKLFQAIITKVFFVILLVHTVIYSVIILRSEIMYPFSSISELSSNINQNDKIVFYPNWLSISFVGESNIQGYFIEGGYWGAFKGSNPQDFRTDLPPELCESKSIYFLTTKPIAQQILNADLGLFLSESRDAIEVTEGNAQILKLKNICEGTRWQNLLNTIRDESIQNR